MRNPDADFRFMALTDLIKELNQRSNSSPAEKSYGLEEAIEKETVELVLELVKDKNTEVKNQAVKTLGVLVRSVSDSRMTRIVDQLFSYTGSDDEQLRDLAGLALKTVVTEIPANSRLAPALCNKLAPRLIAQLQDSSCSSDILVVNLDVLSDLLVRFEAYFRSNITIQTQGLKALLPILVNPRLAVAKRAVTCLGSLAGCCSDEIYYSLINKTVLKGLDGGDIPKIKNSISLVGALARTSAQRLATTLDDLVPLALKISMREDHDLREASLQTLESLLLKCSPQMTGFIPAVIEVATEAIKYDPNYAAVDDADEMDVDMQEEDEENEEDEEFGDEYSDDDDLSWKIRRAAAKLLSTLIATRFELLQQFYKSVSPVLISRFEEREESVKLEIWATFTLLLKQTKIFVGSEDLNPTEKVLKRKRPSTLESQPVDGPLGLLRAQSSAVSKSIIKCLGSKSIAVRQSGFILLCEMIHVLDGGLESQITPLLARIEVSLKSADTAVSGTGTSLKVEVYNFMELFFRTHHPRSFLSELQRFVDLLVSGVTDNYHRIASEAFTAVSSLIKAIKPLTPTSPAPTNVTNALDSIYGATISRLTSMSADQEVKDRAALCLKDLIIHATDQFEKDFQQSLPILTQRLENEITRSNTLHVITQICQSAAPKGEVYDYWIQEILSLVSGYLRKNNRTLKILCFECLGALLKRFHAHLRPGTVRVLISDLHPLIDASDLHILPLAVNTLSLAIPLASNLPQDEKATLLDPVFKTIASPAISLGPALDSLISLFPSVIKFQIKSPEAIIDTLLNLVNTRTTLEQAKAAVLIKSGGVVSPAAASGLQAYYTVSRCLGSVVRAVPTAGEAVLETVSATLGESPDDRTSTFFGLLCLGEIGRSVNLSSRPKLFESALARFESPLEDIRNAAAFAIGNIATGATEVFLPHIFKLIQEKEKHRHLPLQALKEFIAHAPATSLACHSESLWDPLFDEADSQLETSRNVAAECLGKLTLSDPSKFLSRIQGRLKSDSAQIRVLCMTAVRFTLTTEATGFDEQIFPMVPELLGHIRDPDLSVRALALSALDSAAHNKPSLIREALPSLLPYLYAATSIDQGLVRFVEMGPFKHRVDDGLETRKLAYSTMLTLLDTCLNKIDINDFTSRVLIGLTDEDEIKVLCYLMLIRLSHIAPTTIAAYLDQSSEAFSATINMKLKDNSVKQDHERTAELQRSALRALVALLRLSSPATSPKFCQLIRDTTNHPTLGNDFKELLTRGSSSSLG
ncbi:armadillo-type protein [Phakopsora pachyrhizi]|uniref:Armadillo-type protein n=1 Tax=Phakopsora pachyrhizi TaxID=170000 RepID=A0AAV0AJS9_PHAPC|nr:armadillo-type protein [Phakopsora pachyrhizi]